MTTLKEISRRSGYSVTTVSRALNGFHDVTEATRARIAAVAAELNYRPNQVARKLVSGRSGMVGLVLAAPPLPFEHGHFLHVVAGLSEAFSARDLDFVLHVGAGDVLGTLDRMVDRGTLDGFVLTAPEVADPRVALLQRRGVAFVVHGRDAPRPDYAFFDLDNAGLSARAVAALAGLGHRAIALLNGPEPRAYARERLRGFRAALAAQGLRHDPRLVRHGDTSEAYGATAAAQLLDAAAPPTALLCCNSLTAAGALQTLRARGLRVPQDVSVMAHDDDLPQVDAAALDPPLSVTHRPLRAAGAPLADLLIRRIAGEPAERLQVMVEADLILRGSTGPPARPLTA